MSPQEIDEDGSRRVGEPEHHTVVDVVLAGVAGDPAEDRQASFEGLVDGREVGTLQIGQDAAAGGREVDEVAADVAVGSERQVDEGVPSRALTGGGDSHRRGFYDEW